MPKHVNLEISTMNYELQVDINAPRPFVVGLYADQSRMKEWQPSLLDWKLIQGAPGEVGAKCELAHKVGRRTIVMTETVQESNLPEKISLVYEANGVWNPVVNHFHEISSDKTRWNFKTEFQCKGIMRIMAFFMPGAFKRESRRHLESFKAFVEREAAAQA